MRPEKPDADPFAADIAGIGGYVYTTGARLSSRFANQRLTEAAGAAVDFRGKRVLDLGCGDGEYTAAIRCAHLPQIICGVDVTVAALAVARRKNPGSASVFVAASADALPFRNAVFEVGQLRGVLHHLNHPDKVMRETFRVCAVAVIVIEPNGYSPILKMLERWSSYHRAHGEKSYSPRTLDRWVREAGGQVDRSFWVGLVPMFCPDLMARLLKRLEPIVERIPWFNRVSCAVYVLAASRSRRP